jgi:hypothetical protein
MTKSELVALVRERVRNDRGRAFLASVLGDLIKDGLVPPVKRDGNDGLRPMYVYGWRHFHRIAFILGCQQLGMVRRDALVIRIYLAGCKIPPGEVRGALIRELCRTTASLNAQLRSTLMDNQKPLTGKRVGIVARQLGSPDERLEAAGLGTPLEVQVAAVRAARQRPVPSEADLAAIEERLSEAGPLDFGALATLLAPTFGGLFQIGLGGPDARRDQDAVEGVINGASDDQLAAARRAYQTFSSRGVRAFVEANGSTQQPISPAISAIRRTIRFQAEFMVIMVWVALLFASITTTENELVSAMAFEIAGNSHLLRVGFDHGFNSTEFAGTLREMLIAKGLIEPNSQLPDLAN